MSSRSAAAVGTAIPSPALTLWTVTDPETRSIWTIPAENDFDQTLALDFDEAGERLLRVSTRRFIEVRASEDGALLHRVEYEAYKAVFAGSRGRVVAVSGQVDSDNANVGVVVSLDPSDGRIHATLDHDSGLYALAVSPDRRLVAVAGSDGLVRILEPDTLEEIHRFCAHDSTITALAFHPTRPELATGSYDHVLKLWSYPDARLRTKFLGLKGYPKAIAFSPDGRLLAVDGRENIVRVYEIERDAGRIAWR